MYIATILLGICVALSLAITKDGSTIKHRVPKIAIIGAGVGGTVTAYEIKQKADQLQIEVKIDIFEEKDVGGRLSTVEMKSNRFEVGGSIIHKENKYMDHYCKKFGLKQKKEGSDNFLFGLFDGEKFVFEESNYKYLDLFKLLWRYGPQLYFLNKDVRIMLDKFSKIYKNQIENGTPYDDVKDLLRSMDRSFPSLLNKSLRQDLIDRGYHGLLLDEFIFLATSVNYNQNLDMPAFVGAVALAGSTDASQIYAVQGGNEQVPEELLKNSGAKLIKRKVDTISLTRNGTFGLEVQGYTHVYDIVILAAPLVEGSAHNVKFENFPDPIDSSMFKYQRTVATLVHGELNYTFFGSDPNKFAPKHIFSTEESLFFNSISLLSPVTPGATYDLKVFKIFSKEPLSKPQLSLLFAKYDEVKAIDWLAYPFYDTLFKNPSFVLHDNLFHVNAIEWAASAMEMSAIGGHNVMLHVIQAITSNQYGNVKY